MSATTSTPPPPPPSLSRPLSPAPKPPLPLTKPLNVPSTSVPASITPPNPDQSPRRSHLSNAPTTSPPSTPPRPLSLSSATYVNGTAIGPDDDEDDEDDEVYQVFEEEEEALQQPVTLPASLLKVDRAPDRQQRNQNRNSSEISERSASSPRRPRPSNSHVNPSTPTTSNRILPAPSAKRTESTTSARDEFEEHFLNRVSLNGEAHLISAVLDGVNFRQLTDDEEEIISNESDDNEDEPEAEVENINRRKVEKLYHSPLSSSRVQFPSNPKHPSTKRQPPAISEDDGVDLHQNGQRHFHDADDENEFDDVDVDNDDDDFDPEFRGIDLKRHSSISMFSSPTNLRRPNSLPHHNTSMHHPIHSTHNTNNADNCDDCTRLAIENRRLRRQVDELEFELASMTLRSNNEENVEQDDDLYFFNQRNVTPPPAVTNTAEAAMNEKKIRKRKSWTSRILTGGSSLSSSMSSSTKIKSEKDMLKSQVQALTVTTEYLWRKYNTAEIELRNCRLREVKMRMKMMNGKGGEAAVASSGHGRRSVGGLRLRNS